ncbi:hypothetical protein QNI16_09790 [Cytophagaceae bacterium YF14B1]|uniref:Uncharacterized protein n=1 Tax=Xanthocytophaga flava TaxID=3048013 RepID=A0AAE3QK03_9BACT|nr:hypothetical protein [Xanthocytophaga flavus]MDJ1480772.1 hypothetical protein [Xanthocytophaga flavus]
MKRSKLAAFGTIVLILKLPGMRTGFLTVILVFASYSIFSTYLRPCLETFTGISGRQLSVVLLDFSIANFVGNTLGCFPLEKDIYKSLTWSSFLMGSIVDLVVVSGHPIIAVSSLITLCVDLFSVLFRSGGTCGLHGCFRMKPKAKAEPWWPLSKLGS